MRPYGYNGPYSRKTEKLLDHHHCPENISKRHAERKTARRINRRAIDESIKENEDNISYYIWTMWMRDPDFMDNHMDGDQFADFDGLIGSEADDEDHYANFI